jgi:hypothetical protein
MLMMYNFRLLYSISFHTSHIHSPISSPIYLFFCKAKLDADKVKLDADKAKLDADNVKQSESINEMISKLSPAKNVALVKTENYLVNMIPKMLINYLNTILRM